MLQMHIPKMTQQKQLFDFLYFNYIMNLLFFKLICILRKLKNEKFLDLNDYDEIIKLLCNKKKLDI